MEERYKPVNVYELHREWQEKQWEHIDLQAHRDAEKKYPAILLIICAMWMAAHAIWFVAYHPELGVGMATFMGAYYGLMHLLAVGTFLFVICLGFFGW